MSTSLTSIIIVIVSGFLGGLEPIYLKKGSSMIKGFWSIFNRYIIIGIIIFWLATGMFIIALRNGELSVLYPLAGLTYVWVSVYSVFLLGEKMTGTKWFGVALVVLGVSFIGLSAV
jgi:drug/metabolite transporter (DMT)-like permease